MSQSGGGKLIIDIDGDTKDLESAIKSTEKSAKSMAASLAAEYRKAGLSQSDAFKKAWSEIERQGLNANQKVSNSFVDLEGIGVGVFTAIAAAAATVGTAFIAASGKSLQLASDLQEVQNVVDVTFGEGAKQIQAFADAAGDTFGLSELQAKKYSSTLGAMMKSMGLTSDQVLDMSQNLTGLAGDFASFYNLDHQTAFDKIRSGLSGETEPLMQLGINMQVASLEAYALSKGIQTAFKDMTAAEKAILRYNYLLEASADAQGDFARTSAGYANQLRIAGMEVETLGVAFGKTLLPIATQALGGIIEATKELTQEFETSGLKESVAAVGQGFAEIAVSMTEGLVSAIPTVVEALKLVLDNMGLIVDLTKLYIGLWAGAKIAGAIGVVVTALQSAGTATGLLTAATQALNAAWLANPIGLITRLLAILGTALITLHHTSDFFRNSHEATWQGIQEIYTNVINNIIGKINTFLRGLDALVAVANAFGYEFERIGQIQPDGIDVISSHVSRAGVEMAKSHTEAAGLQSQLDALGNEADQVSAQMQNLDNSVGGVNTSLAGGVSGGAGGGFVPQRGLQLSEEPSILMHEKPLTDALSDVDLTTAGGNVANGFIEAMGNGLKRGSSGIGSSLIGAIQGGTDGIQGQSENILENIGQNLVLGLANGIVDYGNSILQDVLNGIIDMVLGVFTSGFGIASPSKVFAEYGKFNMQGLAQGMEDNAELAISPLSKLKSGMQSALSGISMESLQATFSPSMVGTPALAGVGAMGGMIAMQPKVNIYNSTGQEAKTSTSYDNQGNMQLDVMVGKAATARQTSDGTQESRALKNYYGVKQQGIAR